MCFYLTQMGEKSDKGLSMFLVYSSMESIHIVFPISYLICNKSDLVSSSSHLILPNDKSSAGVRLTAESVYTIAARGLGNSNIPTQLHSAAKTVMAEEIS